VLLDQAWGLFLLLFGLAFVLVDMIVPPSFPPKKDEKK